MAVRRLAEKQPESFAFTPENEAWVQLQVAKYPAGRQASAVLALLWRAQEQHDYWLPKPAIEKVADILGMPFIRVLEVATFYSMFNLEPVGRHFIQLCGTTPCVLRGADELKKVCRERIGEQHHVSADGQFSWAEVECLGACCNAPMVQINDDYYEDLDRERLSTLMDDLAAGRAVKVGSQVGRKTSEPAPGKATSLTDVTLFDGSRVGAWRHRFEEEEAREKAKAEAERMEAEAEKAKSQGGTPGAEPEPHAGGTVGDGKADGQTAETGSIAKPSGASPQEGTGPAGGMVEHQTARSGSTPTGALHTVDSRAAATQEGSPDASAAVTHARVEPRSESAGDTRGPHSIDSGAAAAADAKTADNSGQQSSDAGVPAAHPAAKDDRALGAMGAANEAANRDRVEDAVSVTGQGASIAGEAPEAELTDAQRQAEETAMAARLAALPSGTTAEQRADVVGTRPPRLPEPRAGTPDDLKRIRGIGPVNERKLNELGVFHIDQIGRWTRAEVRWVGTYLAFPGRIDRERWVEQARRLAQGT